MLVNLLVAEYWCDGELVWKRIVHASIGNEGVNGTLNAVFGQEDHMRFITKGVPKLQRAEDISVCLPPGFAQCTLSVTRDGVSKGYLISKKVAAELIAAGLPYEG